MTRAMLERIFRRMVDQPPLPWHPPRAAESLSAKVSVITKTPLTLQEQQALVGYPRVHDL